MKEDEAQEIALNAFLWLVEDEERVANFLSISGADMESVRGASKDPAFMGFVLEFLMSDDAHVQGFVRETGVDPDDVKRAYFTISGGQAGWMG